MKIIKFTWRYVDKKRYILYICLSLLMWLISIYLPIVNSNLIDSLTSKELQSAYQYLEVIGILGIINIAFTYWSSITYSKIYIKAVFEISYYVLDHVKKLSIFFFQRINAAYLNQRINNDASEVSQFALKRMKTVILDVMSIVVSALVLININLKITVILLCLLPIYAILYLFFKKKLYKLNYIFKESQNTYFGVVNAQIDHIKFLKFNALYELFNKMMKSKFGIVFADFMRLTKTSNLFSNTGLVITVMANIIVTFIGIREIILGNLTIGRFTIIGTYFNATISSVSDLLSFLEDYQTTSVSYDRISEYLEINTEENGTKKLDSIHNIKIEKLSFHYEDSPNLVSEFDYEFLRGHIYRIKGENGMGKSSILNMITGLYTGYYVGKIKIDDEDIIDLDMYDIRKNKIGIVEQEPMLLNDTILENMTCTSSQYEIAKLEKLCKDLKLDDFLAKQKNGMYSNIEEQSGNISGGEKQKISIIRALLKKPDVLILDEANSALDQESCMRLCEVLKKEKEQKIIIIVSHSNVFDPIIDEEINLKLNAKEMLLT